MLKEIPSGKINVTKNALFFSFSISNSSQFYFQFTILTWVEAHDLSLYMSWTRFVSLQVRSENAIFNFWCCFVLSKFCLYSSFYQSLYFCSTKSMDSLTLKCHNSFQSYNNRKATRTFASRYLIFKLQQEVLKFNDICVSWSSPKTDLEKNFLNLEN